MFVGLEERDHVSRKRAGIVVVVSLTKLGEERREGTGEAWRFAESLERSEVGGLVKDACRQSAEGRAAREGEAGLCHGGLR